ncbi:MAG: bifunctional diaminohydroxyphosphoribosylaminopyrimidine deaminase/5-amino-6-(5-phosphoribosylamino)uracil reductase RibD [Gammaproteobacteria bacterium]|nr:bifunctional diaminohydroxyphosphoribosylaminopyrimidine deaminase/5-amino-6-(5-phosphoribosylamino)uracil reductase RibD [Gammaproteobacteria bacterium]
MARALRLAGKGLHTTDPNPRVGCVVVKNGEIVGEGWHERAGEPHAEVLALRVAGARARGATVYVTLEPCCHHGRTPPCSRALIEAGVARVVTAMQDPNPRVAGQGAQHLSDAGIAIEIGLMEAAARALNPGFVQRMQTGRPYVRVKLAASLDGRTALASGESKWITGAAARHDVQRWRARSSAILTGIGTILADDPSLTVRDFDVSGRQPLRVVADSRLRLPATAKLLTAPGATLVATASADADCAAALIAAGAELVRLCGTDGRVDLAALLAHLARREVNELLVEAGASLSGALLDAGLMDELIVYLAPHVLGAGARAMFDTPVLAAMAERTSLTITDVRAFGPDWRIVAKPLKSEQ